MAQVALPYSLSASSDFDGMVTVRGVAFGVVNTAQPFAIFEV
jgi:hypothetical protein